MSYPWPLLAALLGAYDFATVVLPLVLPPGVSERLADRGGAPTPPFDGPVVAPIAMLVWYAFVPGCMTEEVVEALTLKRGCEKLPLMV